MTAAGNPATTRIVAEYAVDFDVRFDYDGVAAPPPGIVAAPSIVASTYANATVCAAAGAGSPVGRMRAMEFRLSVRTRDEDPAFPFVAPGGVGLVVQRFKLNAVTAGAARVRTITTRVELSNFAAANIQRPAPGGC